MKRLAFAAALLVVSACGSTQSQGPKAKIPEPAFAIDQVVGPGELNFPNGPIDVRYDLEIGNRATEPITFRRIRVRTVNPPGGAYTLEPREYTFNVTIPPNQKTVVTLWAKATGYGVSMRDHEPVTVRAIIYYDTPHGYYNQIFNQELPQ
jgi:hypothetical protein